MHWLRPQAFWLLLLIIPMLFWYWRRRAVANAWSQIVDPHLLTHLLVGVRGHKHYGVVLSLILGWIIAVIILAGPAWQQVQQPVMKSRQPLVILLDASVPMLAADVKPTRFDRAKFKIIDLLRNRHEGEAALVAFTAEPYVVTPLTEDAKTIENLMPALSPEIMPTQGQNLAAALEQAQELLVHADQQKGDILIVSGGINDIAYALPLVKKLAMQGIHTHVLAMGTEAGAPIADPRGGFLRDQHGKMMMANLDIKSLKQIAQSGGGELQTMSVSQHDVHALARAMKPRWHENNKAANEALYWQDEGHWFILLLLPWVLILFRRGVL